MSERSGQSNREEEKRRFDKNINDIERKATGRLDKDDTSSKNNQELMEQRKHGDY